MNEADVASTDAKDNLATALRIAFEFGARVGTKGQGDNVQVRLDGAWVENDDLIKNIYIYCLQSLPEHEDDEPEVKEEKSSIDIYIDNDEFELENDN